MRFNNILHHQLTCWNFFKLLGYSDTTLVYHIIMSISSAALAFGIRKEKETVLIRSLRYIVYSFDYVGASCRCCVYLWIQDVGREPKLAARDSFIVLSISPSSDNISKRKVKRISIYVKTTVISVLLSIPVHLLRNCEYIQISAKEGRRKEDA